MATRAKTVEYQSTKSGLQPKSNFKRETAEADALFLSIGEGAIVTDSEGKISRVNQVALNILQVEEKDMLGMWYPDAVKAEDDSGKELAPIERPIAEVFITGKPVFRKLYFRKTNGSRIAVALTVSPVIVNNEPVGAIEIFRDITEEIRLAKAKDDFIFLASHQLRTPATGVKQYINLLLEGFAGDLSSTQKQFLHTANESNDRQLRIIDDLLKVAAADSGNISLKKKKVDLIPLISAVIDEQSSDFAMSNQQVIFRHSNPTVLADVDTNVMRMVLENLLNNAHKYTYPNKKIEVQVVNNDTSIEIRIKDEGVGIRKVDQRKLFQKFSRIENPLSISSGGTGLGLYWVKKIIDLHGGSIEIESKLNVGTTFIVKLNA